jgi:hypothetical protein
LFVPVLGHRLMLSPTYLAETRSLSREQTLLQIQAKCFELAPAPRPDWATEGSADGWAARDAAVS